VQWRWSLLPPPPPKVSVKLESSSGGGGGLRMGLLPLEFTECLQDSPYFRDSLHSHEKELERTSNNIKELVKEVKNLLNAAKVLSAAQRRLSTTLVNFKFECIGNQQTDDELLIAGSLREFGRLISAIEDEKDRMLDQAFDQFIIPLENFRKEHIGAVKEGKKKFDKLTAKFCASQERHLGLSRKKQGTVLQDADASLEMEHRDFIRAGLEYVCLIQEVQERKKFEFVETLLGFMYGWLTFYHQGHEVAKDFKPHMTELQSRIQKTRENFNASRADIHALMRKMLEVRQSKTLDPGTLNKMFTRSGYLFLMEKKALGTTWSKCYCHYRREGRVFCMIPYNQTTAKIVSNETFQLKSCIRRVSDSIDKRFCFDIVPEDRSGGGGGSGNTVVYTFQALSEEDCALWMDAMDGKEPMYVCPPKPGNAHHTYLDEAGFAFVTRCFNTLEGRGLEDQGLYRVVGVTSKVNRLLTLGLDRKKCDKLNFEDPTEVETKTVTSAIKTFLRNLPEPIMTYKLHAKFIAAAKLETYEARVSEVQSLVDQLPEPNKRMLELLLRHLEKVAKNAKANMMSVSNLGVCFGPTLLRNEEETVAAIMDIKFGNVVVEILIENWRQILCGEPPRIRRQMSSSAHAETSSSSLAVLPVVGPQTVQPPHPPPPSAVLNQSSSSLPGMPAQQPGMTSPPHLVSPHRPPPPPYLPPPPPHLSHAGSTSSLVGGGGGGGGGGGSHHLQLQQIHNQYPVINTNGHKQNMVTNSSMSPHQHQHHQHPLYGVTAATAASPTAATAGSSSSYNSATWERSIRSGGGGLAAGNGSSSSASINKVLVAPPLGSAPLMSHMQHATAMHRSVQPSLSSSSAPHTTASSTSSSSYAPVSEPGGMSPMGGGEGGGGRMEQPAHMCHPPRGHPPPPVKSRLHRQMSESAVSLQQQQQRLAAAAQQQLSPGVAAAAGGGTTSTEDLHRASANSVHVKRHVIRHPKQRPPPAPNQPPYMDTGNNRMGSAHSSRSADTSSSATMTSSSSAAAARERARFSSSSSSVDSYMSAGREAAGHHPHPHHLHQPQQQLSVQQSVHHKSFEEEKESDEDDDDEDEDDDDVADADDVSGTGGGGGGGSSSVATTIRDVESALLSAKAVVSEAAMFNSPAAASTAAPTSQTATVQPLQQLQATSSCRTPVSSSSPSSTTSSSAPVAIPNTPTSSTSGKVRTLYACVGEHESELSFEPNQIITNVRPSPEPGWLQGCLDGRVGLVPENYVEFIT